MEERERIKDVTDNDGEYEENMKNEYAKRCMIGCVRLGLGMEL